ncbi:putative glycosyltransferase At5g20260 [Castanea sativa]|uniref:putative glycosyltransferase At5g20260 n=1 Tax=Castanea sativa TaxID=21020 RepID=UPI003F64927F
MAGFSCSISFVFIPFSLILFFLFFSSSLNIDYSTLFSSSYLRKSHHTNPQQVSQDVFLSTNCNTHKAGNIKKNSLKIIEVGLAKARVAIREAIRTRRYMSKKKETFIPRGSVYRNPYAFHQSHIEMMKRFKVWTYGEGEQPLVHNGPLKDVYAIEGQFIDEIESYKSPFRACNPEEAHVFFLPISVANIVDYVYMPITTDADFYRDRLQRIVMDYVKVVADKHPYWNRSNGADHFMLSCHDWAPDISVANHELFENLIRAHCNANTSEGFQPVRDISIPEIYIPNGTLGPLLQGQGPNNRPILAFFGGQAHGDIREILLKNWKDKDSDVQVHEYLPQGPNYTKIMSRTKYCLCPSGFEVASPRVVEAIYKGCVPVIISDSYHLPLSDVLNWGRFSIQIPVEKIPEIKKILQGIPYEKYKKLQKNVIKVQRHFVLNRPAKPFDALHMVLHSVWLRRLDFALPA